MTSVVLYAGLVVAVALERVAELVVSRRNLRWSRERGGFEAGRGHYPIMVTLHAALLLGCLGEVVLLERAFNPWLGWPMLVVVLLSQSLRWWCITALGPQWNTRVVVVPRLSRVASGPYRWLRHPNYVAVAAEGAALPLVHAAWITAAVFTLLNSTLLVIRIRCEERALAQLVPVDLATDTAAPPRTDTGAPPR